MCSKKAKGFILVRVTLYKPTCCLPSLKQTVRIGFPVNSEQRFNSNFVPVLLFPSLFCSKIANNYVHVCSTNGVSFFQEGCSEVPKSDSDTGFSISCFRLVPR